ncbi:MAG: response regulator transcription factor, partial [Lachnospiraceae bacterium]|nr:response regulator transcription factor [Lachnospiraceae bacterium]
MSKRILVVDDEKLIVKGIRYSLEQDEMQVDVAYDGEEALEKIRANQYSLILLDLMLPKLSGTEVCQQVREFSDVPIVMLTAKGDDMDKIMGLENGADDYITKPFNILEVKARIKGIIRRYESAARKNAKPVSHIIEKGELMIDLDNRRLTIGQKEINLTAREFELLELFVTNPGKVYNRD